MNVSITYKYAAVVSGENIKSMRSIKSNTPNTIMDATQDILEPRTLPKSGFRLAEGLTHLLKEKDFNSITTAEIAKTAKANEALIYRYFGDKRGLLHHVLAEHTKRFLAYLFQDIRGLVSPVEKLRKITFGSINFYTQDLLFSKILLLEVRGHQGYYKSEPYELIRYYTKIILELIKEGQEAGSIRNDIPPAFIRDSILGSIEHNLLPAIIFGRDIDVDDVSRYLIQVVFEGILVK